MNHVQLAVLVCLAGLFMAVPLGDAGGGKKKVLVYTRNYVTNGKGFVHDDIPFAIEAIKKIRGRGWF